MSDDAFRRPAPGSAAPPVAWSAEPQAHPSDVSDDPRPARTPGAEPPTTQDAVGATSPDVELRAASPAPVDGHRRSWRPAGLVLLGVLIGAGGLWAVTTIAPPPPHRPAEIPVRRDLMPPSLMGLQLQDRPSDPDLDRFREEDQQRHRTVYGGEGLTEFYTDGSTAVIVEVTNGLLPLPGDEEPQRTADTWHLANFVVLRTGTVTCSLSAATVPVSGPGDTPDLARARAASQPGDGSLACVRSDWPRNFSVGIGLTGAPSFVPADRAHSLARAVDELFEDFTN